MSSGLLPKNISPMETFCRVFDCLLLPYNNPNRNEKVRNVIRSLDYLIITTITGQQAGRGSTQHLHTTHKP
jgi:hypothetical protein